MRTPEKPVLNAIGWIIGVPLGALITNWTALLINWAFLQYPITYWRLYPLVLTFSIVMMVFVPKPLQKVTSSLIGLAIAVSLLVAVAAWSGLVVPPLFK